MTEMLEKVVMEAVGSNKCIYCGKPGNHENKTKKVKPDLKKVKSSPSALGCNHNKLATAIPGKCTKANHHIIPVHQCFLKVKRLAQIALSVNYNINDGKNGIALPTVCNPYTYDGITQNFGKFKSKSIKDKIAFNVMKELGMQWHVGHHAYKHDETASSDAPDEGSIDHKPYDREVIQALQDLGISWIKEDFCKSDDDESEKIIEQLNDLTVDIRKHLDNFKDAPKSSAPYFVSKVALKYATQPV